MRSLDEALDIYEHYPNRISQWFALNARSMDYQSLGQIDKADADAEHAYAIAQALGEAIYLSGSATRLASLAATKGDYQRAYNLSVEASEMTAKAAREKAGPRVVQLVNRYESENRRREIADLTRRSELQSAQLTQRELQQRWLWTVLVECHRGADRRGLLCVAAAAVPAPVGAAGAGSVPRSCVSKPAICALSSTRCPCWRG